MQKRKAYLFTIVDNINYGTYLQAVASSVFLEKLGCNVTIVKYIRPKERVTHLVRSLFSKNKRFSAIAVLRSLSGIILIPLLKYRFRRFLSLHANLTNKSYYSIDSLRKLPSEGFDFYISGSDQIWNVDYNDGVDEAYYLGFTSKKKIAFSSSFGINNMKDEDCRLVKRLLDEFSFISVRESTSVPFVKEKIGLSKEVYSIVDPTLLLSGIEWNRLLKIDSSDSKKLGKYLLIYTVEDKNADVLFAQAKMIAQQSSLRIVVVTAVDGIKYRKHGIEKIFSFSSVNTFLSLLSQASFVVVSSFHGVAFSINYQKQFLAIQPPKYSNRIVSFLSDLDINGHLVSTRKEMISINDYMSIDYDVINEKLNQRREEAASLIEMAFQNSLASS